MKKLLILLPFLLMSLQANDTLKDFKKSPEKANYIYSPRENTCQDVKIAFKTKTTKEALKEFDKITKNNDKKVTVVDKRTDVAITSGKFKNISFSFFPTKEACNEFKTKK